MKTRSIYAILGLILGAIVDLLLDLLASAIEQQAFPTGLHNIKIGWFIGLSILGLLLGYWLGTKVKVPVKEESNNKSKNAQYVTMTRLRAFYSYVTLRGKGIHLNDIFAFGSRINVDTKDK